MRHRTEFGLTIAGELSGDHGAGPYESRIRWSPISRSDYEAHVATILDKELKRQVTVDGVDYTVAVDPGGIRLTAKGKRNPEVELRWRDLLSGDAAMAVALNASLTKGPAATKPETEQSPGRRGKQAPRKQAR